MTGNESAAGVSTAEKKDRGDAVNFKMVTFSLSGKDYGIDIMNVKEIAKAGKFTFVPNAAPFLRGVYNLRGDIIPVIDLRVFFHLPAEKKEEDALESTLILRIGDHVFGVIVDNIDKVVGISSAAIQPPHPIFGDINIKYISGVVENQSRLYIILDVVRIFSPKEEEKARVVGESGSLTAPIVIAEPSASSERASVATSELDFIKETLFSLKGFGASDLNETWLDTRFAEWKKIKKGADLQLRNVDDATQFLEGFFSPYTACFWSDEYANAVLSVLPELQSKTIQVWNPGCGKGYETFSFACVLKRRYPDARVKIWANDNDLLAISSAPNMVFDMEEIPDHCREHMAKGKNGFAFTAAIRDSIMFEYHDVLNANPFPELDIVLARDLLSFLSISDQARVFSDFSEKMKSRALIILGKNEKLMDEAEWKSIGNEEVSAFIRA